MNWQRVTAVIGRNVIINYRGIDPLIDVFYWPLLDIIVWGYTSSFMQATSGEPTMFLWLSGLVIWHCCVRAQMNIGLSLLMELWSRNVVNLFATPLELSEWMVASMGLGIIDAVVTLIYGGLVVYLVYGLNIFSLGLILLPLVFLLLLSGWIIGFFSASWLVYGGQSKQKIIWVLAWFFLPFSAVFYPLSLLPSWMASIAQWLPMAHAFEGLREYVVTGSFPWGHFLLSFVLSCGYLALSLLFFKSMYQKSRTMGLARLESE